MKIAPEIEPDRPLASFDQIVLEETPVEPGVRRNRRLLIVPQLDTYPRLVSFAQTPLGIAALLGAFAGGLLINHVNSWIETTAAAALMAIFPARRRLLASAAALYWLLFHSTWLDWTFLRAMGRSEGENSTWILTGRVYGILAAVFCGLAVYFRYVWRARGRRVSFGAKRPVLCLVAGYAAVLAMAGL